VPAGQQVVSSVGEPLPKALVQKLIDIRLAEVAGRSRF
jgi:hypothetical protein